jgi:hypothetical protein
MCAPLPSVAKLFQALNSIFFNVGSFVSCAQVFNKINTATVFPKDVGKIYWQGFLQKPIGFYVLAVNASDGHLLAYGANPTAVMPKTDLCGIVVSLSFADSS